MLLAVSSRELPHEPPQLLDTVDSIHSFPMKMRRRDASFLFRSAAGQAMIIILFLSRMIASFHPMRAYALAPNDSRRRPVLGWNIHNQRENAMSQLVHPWRHTTTTTPRLLGRLGSSPTSIDNEDDDDLQDEEASLFGLLNYRRRRKKSAKVQPIPLEGDDTVMEDPRTRKTTSLFGDLFSGMPGINEIMEEQKDTNKSTVSSPKSKPPYSQNSNRPEDWFAQKRQEIMSNYELMWEETRQNLQDQRKADPSSVPSNAEALLKTVLKQEMEREIEAAKNKLSMEQLTEHENNNRRQLEERDLSGPVSDVLKALIQKTQEEFEDKQNEQRELEEFLRYENELKSNPDEFQPQTQVDVEKLLEQPEPDEFEPTTMKEWQMFRSIASRMGFTDQVIESEDKKVILEQLNQWKEYTEKEQNLRSSSGLARGPKMPFEWQELESKDDRIRQSTPDENVDRNEVRRQVNRRAIEALESIALNTSPERSERLKKEISFLKATLESNDYLDLDVSPAVPEYEPGPVDLSDVFSRDGDKMPKITQRSQPVQSPDRPASQEGVNPPPSVISSSVNEQTTSASSGDPARKPLPPPSTPFFQDDGEGYDDSIAPDGKLGSLKEQKLNAMYRRAGAWTEEDKERIRKEYEDFERYEASKRDASGLSGIETSLEENNPERKNMADFMQEDGDVDAEKLLASIGPRPKRQKRDDSNSPSSGSSPPARGDEVTDSLYRTVSAVGGGRYKDDPEKQVEQKRAFVSFRQREEELRKYFDSGEAPELAERPEDDDFNIDEYAEEALSSLGPRPSYRKSHVVNEREFSDMGGVLSLESDDIDDEVSEPVSEEYPIPPESNLSGPDVPDWLKEEQEIRSLPRRGKEASPKVNVEDSFDDTDYEKNLRQLAEFQRRRSGKTGVLGIDIADALVGSSDDYADYKFEDAMNRAGERWGEKNYQSARRDMLEYRQLNLVEVTRLMDTKDSVHVTGTSQYTPRINKPFKDFGAIFRLEGVIADVSQLQGRVWRAVAEREVLRPPEAFEVIRASVLSPESSVRDVFHWSDDSTEISRITRVYREILGVKFDEWMTTAKVSVETHFSRAVELGHDRENYPPRSHVETESVSIDHFRSENERIREAGNAWALVAAKLGLRQPTENEIEQAMLLPPDIAVVQIFGWTRDKVDADILERLYVKALTTGDLVEVHDHEDSNGAMTGKSSLSKEEMLELQFKAWSEVSEKFGFDQPLPEEVLSAFVLNDTRVAVRDGFGWSEDPSTVEKIGQTFENILQRLIHGGEAPRENHDTLAPHTTETSLHPEAQAFEPDRLNEEVFEQHFQAWKAVSQYYGLAMPHPDQVAEAVRLDPKEAINRLFRWSYDSNRISEIDLSFREELKRNSSNSYRNQIHSNTASAKEEEKASFTIADRYQVVMDSWARVAARNGFNSPSMDEVQFSLSFGPAEAIVSAFQWTQDPDTVSYIVEQYKKEVEQRMSHWKIDSHDEHILEEEDTTLVRVTPGVREWLKSLFDVEMSCGIVSHFNETQVEALLNFAGLSDLIPPEMWVTYEKAYRTDGDELLGAALRVERRPDHCVLFDCAPSAPLAAHDNDMQCVGIVGPYPRYELLSADMTTASFDELTALNIRRLFAERVADEPMLDLQPVQATPQKKVKTMNLFEDD